MSTTLTIQNTYYDALFFASASITKEKPFHLRAEELKLLQKLIHYSSTQANITWSSENISKHLFTTITAIDKSIQRLKQKGYINVSTTQRFEKVKSRTIFINWEQIEMVNQLAIEYLEENLHEDPIQPETAPEPSKEVYQLEAAPEQIEDFDVELPIQELVNFIDEYKEDYHQRKGVNGKHFIIRKFVNDGRLTTINKIIREFESYNSTVV